jgi:hypothetical protein
MQCFYPFSFYGLHLNQPFLCVPISDPPHIERGWQNYLIGTDGRAYLDVVNNVTVVGHANVAVRKVRVFVVCVSILCAFSIEWIFSSAFSSFADAYSVPHLDARFFISIHSYIHKHISCLLFEPTLTGHARAALAAQHELAFRLLGDGRLCERDRGAHAARLGTRLGVFRQFGQRGTMPLTNG